MKDKTYHSNKQGDKVKPLKAQGRPPKDELSCTRIYPTSLRPFHHYIAAQIAQELGITGRSQNIPTAAVINTLLEDWAQNHGISEDDFLQREDATQYAKGITRKANRKKP